MPWHLLPMYRYRSHNWQCIDGNPRQPYAVTYSSMGCPYGCDFCNIHVLYGGRKTIYRPPSAVAKEIDMLVTRHGVTTLKFWDELFGLNRKHVLNVCSRLIDLKLPNHMNMWAYMRQDSVDLEVLTQMRKAGFKWIAVGFESGSDIVLEAVNKGGKHNTAAGPRLMELCRQSDMSVMGNFIFGLPGDTLETMQRTLDYSLALGVDWVNYYRFKAYPGSELYANQTQQLFDWDTFTQFPQVSEDPIMRFRDKAFTEFFTNPEYRSRMGKKYGQQAIGQIDEMLALGKPKSSNIASHDHPTRITSPRRN
jgi:anaerobic magnesium-protoporphyrin IX monomethyl ester cyclase